MSGSDHLDEWPPVAGSSRAPDGGPTIPAMQLRSSPGTARYSAALISSAFTAPGTSLAYRANTPASAAVPIYRAGPRVTLPPPARRRKRKRGSPDESLTNLRYATPSPAAAENDAFVWSSEPPRSDIEAGALYSDPAHSWDTIGAIGNEQPIEHMLSDDREGQELQDGTNDGAHRSPERLHAQNRQQQAMPFPVNNAGEQEDFQLEQDLDDMIDDISAGLICVVRISKRMVVIPAWGRQPGGASKRNVRPLLMQSIGDGQLTLQQKDRFFHISLYADQSEAAVGGYVAVCECPAYQQTSRCFHQALLMRRRRNVLDNAISARAEDEDSHEAVQVALLNEGAMGIRRSFSVLADAQLTGPHVSGVKRTVVHQLWSKSVWRCVKCGRKQDLRILALQSDMPCVHIQRVLTWGQQWFADEDSSESENEGAGGDAGPQESNDGQGAEDGSDLNGGNRIEEEDIDAQFNHRAVSYRRRPAPSWLRLDSDLIPLVQPFSIRSDKDRVAHLLVNGDDEMRCRRLSCSQSNRPGAGPLGAQGIELRDCWIFTSTGSLAAKVAIQRCHCSVGRRGRPVHQGPDLGHLDLFNWNNTFIFAHELLDNILANINTGLSFEALATNYARTYRRAGCSDRPFVDSTTLRHCFASYAALMELEVTMRCPACSTLPGGVPEAVVVDALSHSFQRKHMTNTLRPPTQTASTSQIRYIRKVEGQQLIGDREARAALRSALELFSASTYKVEDNQAFAISARDFEPGERFGEQLGPFVHETLWAAAMTQVKGIARAMIDLLRQIAAEESILQFAPQLGRPLVYRLSLLGIRNGVQPVQSEHDALLLAKYNPAMGRAVLAYLHASQPIPMALRQLADFVHLRAAHVQSLLLGTPAAPALTSPLVAVDDDWQRTGCKYGFPALRMRPKYPNVDDGRKKEAQASQSCRKYYSTYGKRELTGGLMAFWCTHGHCLGWHIIRNAEGRDDAFSALVTRFPEPPRYIIYDFACALAPYCLSREPDFFKETLFLIDEMHAHDHTKCSPACFLSSYMEHNAQLRLLKSPIAECGNKGLRRISKTVRYSSQSQALLLTNTYISVWNRLTIRGERSRVMKSHRHP